MLVVLNKCICIYLLNYFVFLERDSWEEEMVWISGRQYIILSFTLYIYNISNWYPNKDNVGTWHEMNEYAKKEVVLCPASVLKNGLESVWERWVKLPQKIVDKETVFYSVDIFA